MIEDQRNLKLKSLEREMQANGMYDSFVGSESQEYESQYKTMRKKQSELIYILKSFHGKIRKLVEIQMNNPTISEYLERLLIQLDFNDFHLNSMNEQKIQLVDDQINDNTHMLDLPINPFPFRNFVQINDDCKEYDSKMSDISSKNITSNKNRKNKKPVNSFVSKVRSTKPATITNKVSKIVNRDADDMISKLNVALLQNSKSKSNSNSNNSVFCTLCFLFTFIFCIFCRRKCLPLMMIQ